MNEVSTTAVADTSATVTATMPAVVCAPWCEEGDGHVTARHPDDQHCHAGNVEIELHREEPQQIVAGDAYYRRDLNLTLWQAPFSEPYAELFVFGMGGVKLTMEELEQVGQHALHLVALMRGEVTA
jgi:hypothetical protein